MAGSGRIAVLLEYPPRVGVRACDARNSEASADIRYVYRADYRGGGSDTHGRHGDAAEPHRPGRTAVRYALVPGTFLEVSSAVEPLLPIRQPGPGWRSASYVRVDIQADVANTKSESRSGKTIRLAGRGDQVTRRPSSRCSNKVRPSSISDPQLARLGGIYRPGADRRTGNGEHLLCKRVLLRRRNGKGIGVIMAALSGPKRY